jgi:hypothetical protein
MQIKAFYEIFCLSCVNLINKFLKSLILSYFSISGAYNMLHISQKSLKIILKNDLFSFFNSLNLIRAQLSLIYLNIIK